MNLTYFGHSCFLIEEQGQRLLFDPFISGNPAASAIDVDALQADAVLLSHGHGDHVADAEAILRRTGALLISNFEIVQWYQQRGLTRGHGMNLGGSYSFPFGKVKMVKAVHSSCMPDGSYGGHPGGFVVEMGPRSFYYAGDTALTLDMKLIGDQHDLDFAVLPIGDNFTMGAEDAALAAVYVGAGRVVGVHYDTFPPIAINAQAAQKAFDVMDVELLLPKIGETITF
jgi:L-ascorbate metabolism protein UlaG (beta-lactamase superfamily)